MIKSEVLVKLTLSLLIQLPYILLFENHFLWCLILQYRVFAQVGEIMYYGLHTHQFCMLLMVIVLVDKTYIIIFVYILFVIYAINLVGNSRRVNEYILLKSVLLINSCMSFKKLDLRFICY